MKRFLLLILLGVSLVLTACMTLSGYVYVAKVTSPPDLLIESKRIDKRKVAISDMANRKSSRSNSNSLIDEEMFKKLLRKNKPEKPIVFDPMPAALAQCQQILLALRARQYTYLTPIEAEFLKKYYQAMTRSAESWDALSYRYMSIFESDIKFAQRVAQEAYNSAAAVDHLLSQVPVSAAQSSTSVMSSVVPPHLLANSDQGIYVISGSAVYTFKKIMNAYKARGQADFSAEEAAFLKEFAHAARLEAASIEFSASANAELMKSAQEDLILANKLEKLLSATPVRH